MGCNRANNGKQIPKLLTVRNVIHELSWHSSNIDVSISQHNLNQFWFGLLSSSISILRLPICVKFCCFVIVLEVIRSSARCLKCSLGSPYNWYVIKCLSCSHPRPALFVASLGCHSCSLGMYLLAHWLEIT